MKHYISHDNFKQMCIQMATFQVYENHLETQTDGTLMSDCSIDVLDEEHSVIGYTDNIQEEFNKEYDISEDYLNRLGIYSENDKEQNNE